MSLPDQEARALRLAEELLYDLVSGREKRIPSATRDRAAAVMRHWPLSVEMRWLLHEEDCHPAGSEQQARIKNHVGEIYGRTEAEMKSDAERLEAQVRDTAARREADGE